MLVVVVMGAAGVAALVFGMLRLAAVSERATAAAHRAAEATEQAAREARQRDRRARRDCDVLFPLPMPDCPPSGGNASVPGGCR